MIRLVRNKVLSCRLHQTKWVEPIVAEEASLRGGRLENPLVSPALSAPTSDCREVMVNLVLDSSSQSATEETAEFKPSSDHTTEAKKEEACREERGQCFPDTEVSWRMSNGKREEPAESHYEPLKQLCEGDVLRLWIERNETMHLCTVIVIRANGTEGTCLKIDCPDPADVNKKYQSYHAKIEKKEESGRHLTQPGTETAGGQGTPKFVTGILDLDSEQGFREDCWTDLKYPWNISVKDRYMVAWCGELTNDSFRALRDKHFELYRGPN